MKNNDFEKYISELSPELQEKARQCKDMAELNELLAENEVELSDDALEAVAGGCSVTDSKYSRGDVTTWECPECNNMLYYWERSWLSSFQADRLYCPNQSCPSCHKWFWIGQEDGMVIKDRW